MTINFTKRNQKVAQNDKMNFNAVTLLEIYTSMDINHRHLLEKLIQCDQMARLFFQYLAIYKDEILPKNTQKSPKVGSQLYQISNKPLKCC